jgi:peroxidase
VAFGSDEAANTAIVGIGRSPLAARHHATYGSVENVDAFVGMIAESHVPGTEFGQLELPVWANQFRALRDGDRFFYANDPALRDIGHRYHVTYRSRLSQLIALNTDVPQGELQPNVFLASGEGD